MKESTISKTIIREANRLPCCKAIKIAGGPFIESGTPDIHVTYFGQSFWFEVKKPGKEKTVTNKQRFELNEWWIAGAVAAVVTSWDQVREILMKSRKKGS